MTSLPEQGGGCDLTASGGQRHFVFRGLRVEVTTLTLVTGEGPRPPGQTPPMGPDDRGDRPVLGALGCLLRVPLPAPLDTFLAHSVGWPMASAAPIATPLTTRWPSSSAAPHISPGAMWGAPSRQPNFWQFSDFPTWTPSLHISGLDLRCSTNSWKAFLMSLFKLTTVNF